MKAYRKGKRNHHRVLAASLLAMVLAGPGAVMLQAVGAPFGVTGAHAEITRTLKLGQGKSAVMRLPAGIKDILLGNTKIADVVLRSRQTMYVFGRKVGQTNVFLLDAQGNPVASVNIIVSIDPRPLQRMIKKVLPDTHITVESTGDQIILGGTAKTPAQVNKAMQLAVGFLGKNLQNNDGNQANTDPKKLQLKIINAVRVTGKDQVTIKVKLAEVQRQVMKQLRTNLANVRFNFGGLTSFIFGGTVPFSLGNNLGEYGGSLAYNKGSTTIEGLFQAMERDGLMRLLAEPTLTAVSGESARFMAGGEVPIFAGYDPLTGTYKYKLKPVGVMLGFSPLVLSENRISLKVRVEVSEVSSRYSLAFTERLSVPGTEKREAMTTVELPSGGTLALAGMIHEQTKQNIDGVPGLKNLPILGALFRSREFQTNQTELVVLATPYIVSPRNEKKFTTPLDRLNLASDYQNYFLGRLQRVYGGGKNSGDGNRTYHGNVGFIVE